MVMRRGLLPVLANAHITECRFASQLGALHQRANAIDMSNYFTRWAFHTRTVFLQIPSVNAVVNPFVVQAGIDGGERGNKNNYVVNKSR